MKIFALEHYINCQHSDEVIVAASPQDLPLIERLLKNALEKGIRAERLDNHGIRHIEPHSGVYPQGIHCPDTAVIDSKAVLTKLQELLKAAVLGRARGCDQHGVDGPLLTSKPLCASVALNVASICKVSWCSSRRCRNRRMVL